jgi:hypothetical protein
VASDPDDPWTSERFEAALAPFLAEYGTLRFDHAARMGERTRVRQEGRHLFEVQQILVDPDEVCDWAIEGTIDLRADQAPEGPMIRIDRIVGG